MAKKGLNFFSGIIVFIALFFIPAEALSQQVSLSPRENIIFTTLNNLQSKEGAIMGAMQEAQLQLAEAKFAKEITTTSPRSSGFKDLASRAHPYLTLTMASNDNVDNVPQAKGSIYYTVKPGVKMNFRERGKSLDLNLYIQSVRYNNRKRSNSDDINLETAVNFPLGRYIVSLGDTFYSNHISTPELGIDDDLFTNYFKNTFDSKIGRYFNRLGFDLGYQRVDYKYEKNSDEQNSRTEGAFNFNNYVRVGAKTQLLAEYHYGRTRYEHDLNPSKDYRYDEYVLGATGVLSAKLTGTFKMGYKSADYKDQDDSRDTYFSSSIGYRISDRSDMAFTYKYQPHIESTRPNSYIENDIKLSMNHRPAFNRKFNLSLSYGADMQNYNKRINLNNAKSNLYTWNFTLTYAFRQWLDFSLGYANTSLVANIGTVEYKKNTVTFTTNARF